MRQESLNGPVMSSECSDAMTNSLFLPVATRGEQADTSCWRWNQPLPICHSPWVVSPALNEFDMAYRQHALIGCMTRKEGHVYSLAAAGDLLYTGSESKNIRVWKMNSEEERSVFRSRSGFVKTIAIAGAKIFTGHEDGKIRVWKLSSNNPNSHRRIGSLPSVKDSIKNSLAPKNLAESRKNSCASGRIKHCDAVSCLSLNSEVGLLYSGSWDKTIKVWRISDSKCLERIDAHHDAINSVVAAFGDLVFSGSADGGAKVWRRRGTNPTRHSVVRTLMRQEYAVTSLAVEEAAGAIYCASSDGLVNYWEYTESSLNNGGVLRGHELAVLCLAAAGGLVFSGSADNSICVWRRNKNGVHMFLSLLRGHTGPVKCLDVVEDRGSNPDEPDPSLMLYSGSLDSSVNIWLVSGASPRGDHCAVPSND